MPYFIPYFILYGVILNEFVSLPSLPVCLLLIYRRATDYCALILYPETLLKSFISSNSFLARLEGFLYIVSCHLQAVTLSFLPLQPGYLLPLFLV